MGMLDWFNDETGFYVFTKDGKDVKFIDDVPLGNYHQSFGEIIAPYPIQTPFGWE